ncbi:MAG: hypothetical protein NVS1B5_20630 [Gemmatimonadaceae bacterium]
MEAGRQYKTIVPRSRVRGSFVTRYNPVGKLVVRLKRNPETAAAATSAPRVIKPTKTHERNPWTRVLSPRPDQNWPPTLGRPTDNPIIH